MAAALAKKNKLKRLDNGQWEAVTGVETFKAAAPVIEDGCEKR
jgi:hypothetical protein